MDAAPRRDAGVFRPCSFECRAGFLGVFPEMHLRQDLIEISRVVHNAVQWLQACLEAAEPEASPGILGPSGRHARRDPSVLPPRAPDRSRSTYFSVIASPLRSAFAMRPT